jgi:protein TIF31
MHACFALRFLWSQDSATLGVIILRYRGFTVVVKATGNGESSVVGREPLGEDIDIEDQPEGGANALNVNRC